MPPEVKFPQMITPNRLNRKNSQLPNCKETWVRRGVRVRTQITLIRVPAGGCGSQKDGQAALAPVGQGESVQGRGRAGRGPGNVQKNRCLAAAGDGSHIDADQGNDGAGAGQTVGQACKKGHGHGGTESWKHAHDQSRKG